ncbi:hypothetical protein ACFQU3_19645 [Terrabacter sp. GCM10028922]|uniref:hypothetical protein n=1 Tax=Terrabacter sp. GCM10028922 TaxID=3273428 RepID=UPI003619393D
MTRRRAPWFFGVVLALGSIKWAGSESVEVPLGDGTLARLMPLAGMAIGSLWQLLDRRDLAKRLTVPALFVVIGGLLQAATGDVSAQVQGMVTGLGLVAGLVLAEQWLRRSDSRAERTPEDSVQSTVSD